MLVVLFKLHDSMDVLQFAQNMGIKPGARIKMKYPNDAPHWVRHKSFKNPMEIAKNRLWISILNWGITDEIRTIANRLDQGGVILQKHQLLEELQMGWESTYQKGKENQRNTIVSCSDVKAESVCLIHESKLNPIVISEMIKGKIQKGKILWGTLIGKCFKLTSVMVGLEDENGITVLLALYNCIHQNATITECEANFSAGTQIGIKEPYYKLAADGTMIIRVDHPYNLVNKKNNNFSKHLSAQALKNIGNRYFKSKQFLYARKAYTQALKKNPEILLHETLLSNRAATQLQLNAFKNAIVDCQQVLKSNPTHGKARYRFALALAGLGRYEESSKILEALKQLGCKEAQNQLIRVKRHFAESNGVYDITLLREKQKEFKNGNHKADSDFANYYGPVEIKQTDNMGRGVFVTRDILAGELIFAEKAIAFSEPSNNETTMILNDEDGSVNKQSQQENVSQCLNIVLHSNIENYRMSFIYDGTKESTMRIPNMRIFRKHDIEIKNVPTLSAQRIRNIVKYNSFETEKGGTGTWILASFMNSKKDDERNTDTVSVGRMKFIKARRFLPSGTQLFIDYGRDIHKGK